MIAIACVDKKFGIGKDGKLLVSIPEDMKFFRENTQNQIVVMGRKTLFSFKNKEPLKNRINIVFTNNKQLSNEYKSFDNIFFINSESELLSIINNYKNKKTFIIGGEQIYKKLLHICNEIYLTHVDNEFKADSYFPNPLENGYKIYETSDDNLYESIKYKFVKYRKETNY